MIFIPLRGILNFEQKSSAKIQKYTNNIGLKAVNLTQRSNHLKNVKFKFILWITVAELVTI